MTPPTVVKLSEAHLHLQLHGPSAFLPTQFGSVEQRGGNVILWDPGVPGVVGGEGELSAESDHDGERHLDGEELLYLISGAVRVLLELEDGSTSEVPLCAGEALLVPRGVWHRLIPSELSRLLFLGGGRTEVRLRGDGRGGAAARTLSRIYGDADLQHVAAQTQEAAHRTKRRAAESALIRRDRFT